MISFFPEGALVAELGGGSHPIFRPNIDARSLPEVDIIANFNQLPLPIQDQSYDGIFAHYLLEHISWRLIPDFLLEVFRILKPSGKAVFFTANTRAQAEVLVMESHWDYKQSQLLFGDQDYPENSHKVSLDPLWIKDLLEKAGFSDIEVSNHPNSKTDMVVQAVKIPTNEISGIKLNLGSFMDLVQNEWNNIDILPLNTHIPKNTHFLSYDLRKGIPYNSSTCSVVCWSHMAEHLKIEESQQLMKECFRVLKLGGILRISVPDMKLIIQKYLDQEMSVFDSDQPQEYRNSLTQGEKFSRIMFIGHLQCFDEETLTVYLQNARFQEVIRMKPGESRSMIIQREYQDTHPYISLILEGIKK